MSGPIFARSNSPKSCSKQDTKEPYMWSWGSSKSGDISFLDALASLDLKLSVSEWVIYRFQLAHLRVFQSYLFLYSWGTFTSQYVWSTLIRLPPHISIWTFLHFLHLYFLYTWGAFTSYVWSTFLRLPPPVSTWTSTNRPTGGFLRLQCCIPTTKPSCN